MLWIWENKETGYSYICVHIVSEIVQPRRPCLNLYKESIQDTDEANNVMFLDYLNHVILLFPFDRL